MTETATTPQPAPPDGIAPYGTLIEPGEDGAPFGPADAALELGAGTPRLTVVRLRCRPLLVKGVTRHARVTQCLASFGAPQHPCTKRLVEAVPVPEPGRRRARRGLRADEVPSPVRPADQTPPTRRYREVSPGHAVQEWGEEWHGMA